MKQYLDLLQEIKDKGTWKDAARENMPRTLSLFGTQMRFNLQEGFPILTTKKISFKNVVTELLWFLKGDTNIKYLVDNGCNIWNEDAYNYYKKIASKNTDKTWNQIYCPIYNGERGVNFEKVDSYSMFTYEEFIEIVKNHSFEELDHNFSANGYKLGDCGKQYGWLWRNWKYLENKNFTKITYVESIDQISELINSLKNNPMSRRHILTAWNPATLDDMALNACHCFVQFNCRPINFHKRSLLAIQKGWKQECHIDDVKHEDFDKVGTPKYYLDCQMYQRSADVFLGVPYNISSYALFTEILSKICNMIPGEFVHTFGDVHIYENHIHQVNEQLTRTPNKLPELVIGSNISNDLYNYGLDKTLPFIVSSDFKLEGYNPQPSIKGKLSTGLK